MFQTEGKRFSRAKAGMRDLLRRIKHHPVEEQAGAINRVLRDQFNYYGIAGNATKLHAFWDFIAQRCCPFGMTIPTSHTPIPTVSRYPRLKNLSSSSHRCLQGTLCTTSAVITEAMHLLKHDRNGPRRLAEFVQAAGLHVFESTQPHQLSSAASLMEKYSNTTMDFADATLVLLGGEAGINQIVTLDRRGFRTLRTFRTAKGKPFEILPRRDST